MTAPIRLLVERGQLLVGDDTFPGGVTPDGGLSVGGHDVRPLRLAERGHLLAVAAGLLAEGPPATRLHGAGPHVAGRLARLLGALAAPSARDADVHLLAAVEAVALYLAGAAMSGPLARTILLVARATGQAIDGIGSMGALDADRLAEVLAAGLDTTGPSEPTGTGDGWTTISFEPEPVVAPGGAGAGAAVVRDRLAARLIVRDGQPLSRELLDRLLDPGDAPGRDGDDRAPGGGGAPGDRPVASTSMRTSVGTAPTDRWLAPIGSFSDAPSRTGPPADRRGAGDPGPDVDPSRRPAPAISVDETSDVGMVGPDRSSDAGAQPGSGSGDRQHPVPPTGPPSPVEAVAAAGGHPGQTSGRTSAQTSVQTSAQRSASELSTFSFRPRPPDSTATSTCWPHHPAPRAPVHDPGGRATAVPAPVDPSAAVMRPTAVDDRDPEAVARALDHVADLHGLRR